MTGVTLSDGILHEIAPLGCLIFSYMHAQGVWSMAPQACNQNKMDCPTDYSHGGGKKYFWTRNEMPLGCHLTHGWDTLILFQKETTHLWMRCHWRGRLWKKQHRKLIDSVAGCWKEFFSAVGCYFFRVVLCRFAAIDEPCLRYWNQCSRVMELLMDAFPSTKFHFKIAWSLLCSMFASSFF